MKFRQFRLDKLDLGQLNREFDLVRQAIESVSNQSGRNGNTGSNGTNGTNGTDKWELEFSMGYHGVGSNIIDYVSPASDGLFWFTPDTKAVTTAVDDIFFICEWRPEKSYSECSLTLDVNDLNLGVHTVSVDIEVVKNATGTGIGTFGLTSGSLSLNTGYVGLAISTSDTVGLRCKLHKNGSYPPSCPGPDSSMNMTAKVIFK